MICSRGHDHDHDHRAALEAWWRSRNAMRPPSTIARAIFTRSGCCRSATIWMRSRRSCRSLPVGAHSHQALQRGGPRLRESARKYGTAPTILTPEALAGLRERLKLPPDDGGQWTGPKIARARKRPP